MKIAHGSLILSLVCWSSFMSESAAFATAAAASRPSFGLAAAGDTPEVLPEFSSLAAYEEYLEAVSALPKGFAIGTAEGSFVSEEAPAMGKLPIRATVIHLTEGATDQWAATFTKNRFPGAPVLVGRSRLSAGGPLQALVINNKVSNVCAGGGDGVANAEHVCAATADALDLPDANLVLPSSTGVIGWRLPARELASDIVPRAVEELQTTSAVPAAKAICTTDRWPKVRSATLSNGARLVGIAKGAGMIEPNMATMLSYLMTDAAGISQKKLQTMLTEAVNGSYNSISVDGDESTSDTVVLVSSKQVDGTDEAEFREALQRVCQGLSQDIVRNGEGTGHVLRVAITGFPGSDYEARCLGRHVVNSPLFKCAVSGNDPNTGRLAGAIGSFLGKLGRDDVDASKLALTLGGRCIFANGQFVLEGGDAVERELSDHMKEAEYDEHGDYPPHQKCVEIGLDFGTGSASATVLGSDLTAEYVAINADYRS